MEKLAWLTALALLGGCAGVSINPISPAKDRDAHTDAGGVSGYIVYAPMLVVQIGETELCTQRAADGKCSAMKLVCTMSAPTVMPDYDKPFRVDIHSGLGKAGAEIQIADGWRLAGVKDTSDNTALLTFLEKAAGIKTQGLTETKDKPCGSVKPGLYRWTPGSTKQLTPLSF